MRELICTNGIMCDHPLCEDHNGVSFWDHNDWPLLGDPWWDGLQSQADYRRMMRYFDVRGGTL